MSSEDLYSAPDFESFWSIYERLHADPRTRALHAVATTSAMVLLTWGVVRRNVAPILLAPLVDHAIAQASHRLIEHNRTTPWRSPGWHLRAELRLWRRTIARSCPARPREEHRQGELRERRRDSGTQSWKPIASVGSVPPARAQ